MYIQPVSQNNVSMNGAPTGNRGGWNFLRKISQKIFNKIPEKTFNADEKSVERLKKYDTFMSKPAENRLIMGATAILTQPAIDYYNHRVDDETRTVSRNRTIAKVIAGTAVGIAVRSLCYKMVDNMTNVEGKGKYATTLMPSDKFFKELAQNAKKLKNYKSALATFVALCVMSLTNLFIDAPLTVYLTNLFNKKTLKEEKQNASESRLKEGIYG